VRLERIANSFDAVVGAGLEDNMTMEQKLIRLAKLGCHPVVARRGKLWRAHINACGNQWDEHDTPSLALDAAIHQWERAGRPMDGLADSPNS
jgi:hypothetical protein